MEQLASSYTTATATASTASVASPTLAPSSTPGPPSTTASNFSATLYGQQLLLQISGQLLS